MDKSTDTITRDELLRAIGVAQRCMEDGDTVYDALTEMAREISEPHECRKARASAPSCCKCGTRMGEVTA